MPAEQNMTVVTNKYDRQMIDMIPGLLYDQCDRLYVTQA